MAGLAPHECAERCPSYDTCYIASSAELYYQVGDQRFACDGLDCDAASRELGDYCCERGQFAPGSNESGGGGGCTLADTGRSPPTGAAGLALAVVIGAARRRRPRRLTRART